jgi:hypothetical protein
MQNRLFSCNGMCRCEQIEGIACQYQSRSLANLLFAANFGLVKKLLLHFVHAIDIMRSRVDFQRNVLVFSQRILPETDRGLNRCLKKQ